MKLFLHFVKKVSNVESKTSLSYILPNFNPSFSPFIYYSLSFTFAELTKINTFYSEKLAEATRKFAALKSELSCQYDHHNPKGHSDNNFFRLKKTSKPKEEKLPPRKLQDLKLAFSEYYLSLVLLQNYQNLNFTGELYVCSNRIKR